MARYIGPVCRICRRQGEKLFLKGERCFSPKCSFERRPTPPGMRSMRRRKVSDWGLQLREKQKARAIYGVLERQFQHYYEEAMRRPGVTGQNLLQLLEGRLDNVVYRLGWADSRNQGRQVVRHGHISLNGRKTNIPSALVKPGDLVSWTQQGKETEYYKIVQEQLASKQIPSWLGLDPEAMTGRVMAQPEISEIGATFDASVIVEFYSR